MKPSWVKPISILGIIFGALGLLGAGQLFTSPYMMKMQQEMFQTINETSTSATTSSADKPVTEMTDEELKEYELAKENAVETSPELDLMTNMMNNMFETPEWYGTFCYSMGLIGLLVSGFIILSAIFLLIVKKGAPKLFITACWIAVSYALIKAGLSAVGGTMMLMSHAAGSLFGVIIYSILAVVVMNSDRSIYEEEPVLNG